ncbi:MAG: threonine ammonia-lyase [Bacteroidota bacterium]
MKEYKSMVSMENIYHAYLNLKGVVVRTPLLKNLNLSEKFDANVLLKREDLQVVRSYKIRGAYNKIFSLSDAEKAKGIVCASAGNHAQGVAYSCRLLGIYGRIYMPTTTPKQKITQVKMFGREFIEIIIQGDTFDDAFQKALEESISTEKAFIPPFDDVKIIEGQATTALEIIEDLTEEPDYIFIPIGGGGLASGISTVIKNKFKNTKIIGVEPEGAPSMKTSIDAGENITLQKIDTFVDGAAVKRVGDITFEICRNLLDDIVLVPEGKVCTTILKLYNEEAIVVEPAGALTIAALDFYKEEIKGKNVVCLVSGSNNDITRTEEIRERSMFYEGLKHYFIIRFAQRAGALREFLMDVLGPNDDITYFEYSKKNNREKGPAIIGVEIPHKDDFEGLIDRMRDKRIVFEYLNDNFDLFQHII